MPPNNYIIDGIKVTADEYNKQKYEDLRVRVPKGKKAVIANFAQREGKSMNSYINEALDEKMERCKDKEGG